MTEQATSAMTDRFDRLRAYVAAHMRSNAAELAGTWSYQNGVEMKQASFALHEGDWDEPPEGMHAVTMLLPHRIWNYVGETLAYDAAKNEWASVENTIVAVLTDIMESDRETPER